MSRLAKQIVACVVSFTMFGMFGCMSGDVDGVDENDVENDVENEEAQQMSPDDQGDNIATSEDKLAVEALGGSSALPRECRIRVKANGRYWHENGLGDKLVSTRFEVNDDYTRFIFEPQTDGSYRIRVKADNRYLHVYGDGERLVNTIWQPNDNYTRFFFESTGTGYYRIRLKADNRYLHVYGSGAYLVNTYWQPNDDYTRFKLTDCRI